MKTLEILLLSESPPKTIPRIRSCSKAFRIQMQKSSLSSKIEIGQFHFIRIHIMQVYYTFYKIYQNDHFLNYQQDLIYKLYDF